MHGRIHSLQVLRFVAASMVVLLHAEQYLRINGYNSTSWFWFGGSGVDIFFVLSGFVVTLSSTGQSARDFLLRRVARIVPLYWTLTIGLSALVAVVPDLVTSTTATLPQVLQSLLFIPYMRDTGVAQPVLFLGWTLNYEMFFYLLIAISLALRVGILPIVALLLLLVAAGYAFDPQATPIAFWTDGIVLEFAFGAALALAYGHGVIRSLGIWPLPFGVLLFAVMAQLTPSLPREIAGGIPALLVVAGTINISLPSGRAAGGIIRLGDASYALYLIHPFVIQALGQVLTRPGLMTTLPPGLFAFGGLALASLLSVAVFTLFERPVMRLILGASGRARVLQSGAPPPTA